MRSLVLAAVVALAAGRPQVQLPAGLSAAACPNYPFCGAAAPADFPVPVVGGEPVAPVLNTTPEQTRYWQEAQVVRSPAAFPVPVIAGENVAPGYNTVPAQTAAHENHLLIAQQQQLQQLIDAQTIQHRVQQQEIEAARCQAAMSSWQHATRPPCHHTTLPPQPMPCPNPAPGTLAGCEALSSPRLSLDPEHQQDQSDQYLQNSIHVFTN